MIDRKEPYFINKRNDELIKEILIVVSSFLILFSFIFWIFQGTEKFIILLTISLATTGWLFTNFTASRNSIRQHTITVLTQLRMSTEFMKNANTLQKLFDSQITIDKDYFDKLIGEEQIKNKESIRYILNYLEFVAAGIRLGDLDEQLVRAAQGRMFITSYEMCEPFVSQLNSERKTTYEHLIATYERWK